jgi:protein gp37
MTRYGRDFDTVTRAKDATFRAPEKWQDPRMVFTCSWSDFFIEDADDWRGHAWSIILETKRHTYQILTKRPERMVGRTPFISRVPDNCWLGASVENKQFYRRIPYLNQIDATVRFLSVEPMLGPMDDIPLEGIRWLIVGTESGPGARFTDLDWIRRLRDKCQAEKVAFFVKQLTTQGGIKIPYESWPEDLKVREWPVHP